MDDKDYWQAFSQTGNIEDYLNYLTAKNGGECTNEHEHQGDNNQGTNGG